MMECNGGKDGEKGFCIHLLVSNLHKGLPTGLMTGAQPTSEKPHTARVLSKDRRYIYICVNKYVCVYIYMC